MKVSMDDFIITFPDVRVAPAKGVSNNMRWSDEQWWDATVEHDTIPIPRRDSAHACRDHVDSRDRWNRA